MKLAQLLSVFPQLKWGDSANEEVKEITQDSRLAKPGAVFVAIRGTTSDGHEYVSKAAEQGALALIVEDDTNVPKSYDGAVVKTKNTRAALDLLAQRFYGNPAQELFCAA